MKGLAVRERSYDVFGNKRIETDPDKRGSSKRMKTDPDRRAHFKKTLTDELEKRGGFRRDWERYGRNGMTRGILTRRGGLKRQAEADDEMPVARGAFPLTYRRDGEDDEVLRESAQAMTAEKQLLLHAIRDEMLNVRGGPLVVYPNRK